mmetsp:Transcript_12410/g.33183  ORF Transcript_12410/g.33183 Transcript_12410/m.33183 type:complete len:227 (-) Transcript_12410:522-1202(-)
MCQAAGYRSLIICSQLDELGEVEEELLAPDGVRRLLGGPEDIRGDEVVLFAHLRGELRERTPEVSWTCHLRQGRALLKQRHDGHHHVCRTTAAGAAGGGGAPLLPLPLGALAHEELPVGTLRVLLPAEARGLALRASGHPLIGGAQQCQASVAHEELEAAVRARVRRVGELVHLARHGTAAARLAIETHLEQESGARVRRHAAPHILQCLSPSSEENQGETSEHQP